MLASALVAALPSGVDGAGQAALSAVEDHFLQGGLARAKGIEPLLPS